MKTIAWLAQPESHDYDAAASYLELTLKTNEVNQVVSHLKTQPVIQFKAKDILRAARLATLDEINSHVQHDLKKIHSDTPLSPILLVRGNAKLGLPLVIADGYHRVCAIEAFDEDQLVHCKLADLE